MTSSTLAQAVVTTPSKPAVGKFISTSMARQWLALNLSNGQRHAACDRLRSVPSIRPDWNDPRAKHPDRQLYVVAEVAPQIFPGNLELQQAFIEADWTQYACKSDREAISNFPAQRAV